MTQNERLTFLMEAFKAYYGEYRNLAVPEVREEQRRGLRSLMNIRIPGELDPETLRVQDAYLQERAAEKGVVTLADIPALESDPRLSIWQGDITRLVVDAIVNAANSRMLGCFVPLGGDVAAHIHSFP